MFACTTQRVIRSSYGSRQPIRRVGSAILCSTKSATNCSASRSSLISTASRQTTKGAYVTNQIVNADLMDAPRGFEPRLTESESVVLPLDDRAAKARPLGSGRARVKQVQAAMAPLRGTCPDGKSAWTCPHGVAALAWKQVFVGDQAVRGKI